MANNKIGSIDDKVITVDVRAFEARLAQFPPVGNQSGQSVQPNDKKAPFLIERLFNEQQLADSQKIKGDYHKLFADVAKSVPKEAGLAPVLSAELKKQGKQSPGEWEQQLLKGKDLTIIMPSSSVVTYPASDLARVARNYNGISSLISDLAGFALAGKPFATAQGLSDYKQAQASWDKAFNSCGIEQKDLQQGLAVKTASDACAQAVPKPDITKYLQR